MTENIAPKKKAMPKGGRKGGAVFPRYSLADALEWVKKLVSKTHSGPQARDVIYAGVVGSGSGTGNIKISTLKQFGFLEGDSKAYTASELAKAVNVAPPEELGELLKKASLGPAIFSGLYNTFHDDTVSKAKLKQRAVELGVHPDEADTSVAIYISTLQTAGLVEENGDKVIHSAASHSNSSTIELNDDIGENDATVDSNQNSVETSEEDIPEMPTQKRARGMASVSINIDSTLDTEKLAGQLALLRKYGVI